MAQSAEHWISKLGLVEHPGEEDGEANFPEKASLNQRMYDNSYRRLGYMYIVSYNVFAPMTFPEEDSNEIFL